MNKQQLDEIREQAAAFTQPDIGDMVILDLLDYIEELEAENELQRVHIAKLGEQYNSAIDWGNTLRGMLAKYEPYRGHPSRGKGRQQ